MILGLYDHNIIQVGRIRRNFFPNSILHKENNLSLYLDIFYAIAITISCTWQQRPENVNAEQYYVNNCLLLKRDEHVMPHLIPLHLLLL